MDKRKFARTVQAGASQLRQVFPDWANAELIEITPDDRGVVRLDGGERITISFPPVGASAVGKGARGRIQFVRRGNKQTPQWRTCCEKNGKRAAAAVVAHWPSFRNGNNSANCIEGTFSAVGLSSGEQSYPLFIRQYEGKIFLYHGSFSDENDIEGPYYLRVDDEEPIDLGEDDVWYDFQVNEVGVLALISRYGFGGYDGNVTFETSASPENGDAPLLRQYDEDNNNLWTYEFPTISEYYTWDDEGPPGSGGGSSGGGDS